MASVVGALGGIKYGAKLYGYFFLVLIIGGVITVIGIGIVLDGLGIPAATTNVGPGSLGRQSPEFGQILLGAGISLSGVGVTQAGFLGAIYKIVTDAVYTGNKHSRKDMLSNEQ